MIREEHAVRTTHDNPNNHPNTNSQAGGSSRWATNIVAGLAAVAALALGATACGSDGDPGDDPIEVPGTDAPADEPIGTDEPLED